MNAPIWIIIPTYCRNSLLERTLHSLSGCVLPDGLQRVIVAENGKLPGAMPIVEQFKDSLPVEYRYTPTANKSRALNEALQIVGDGFIIFYDDDVRIHPENPRAYARAVEGWKRGRAIGGRCNVDYEEAPPRWLLKYLPPSAKGWSKGGAACELPWPQGAGFNWGAFAADIRAVGAFNENRGPGTRARGQETDMQHRLGRAGVSGWYLPEAIVWHYVPKERCSPEWTLERTGQTAAFSGMNLRKRHLLAQFRHALICRLKAKTSSVSLRLFEKILSAEMRFSLRYRIQWNEGVLEGLRTAASGVNSNNELPQ